MLKVLALVQKGLGINPGQRFRLEQWAPHLRTNHRIDLAFRAFESPELTRIVYTPGHLPKKALLMAKDFVRRASIFGELRDFDAVVVYREAAALGPAVYEWLLERSGVPFLLDFDDAIWMPSSGVSVNGAFARLRFASKTKDIARRAAGVTVGNDYLARWAKQYNRNVHVVPTTIDMAKYDVQPEPGPREVFTIGWMGSHSTLRYLEDVRGAVERFGKTRRVKFVVVADVPLARPFANVATEFVKWSADREAADIGAFDVGIMPLPDDPYTHGKCGCKALQYMAAGRPAIVSPVGVNTDIVQDGVSGLWARTEDEWVTAFERVASSRELWRQLRATGRKTVEERFTGEAAAARFAAAVESIVPSRVDARSA